MQRIIVVTFICFSAIAQDIPVEKTLRTLTSTFENLANQIEKSPKLQTMRFIKKGPGHYSIDSVNIFVQEADITTMHVDAIVNAANTQLTTDPGGVAGAIWKATDPQQINDWIAKEKKAQRIPARLPIGSAIATPSFDLKEYGIQYIIHTPGPNCGDGEDINLLYDSYRNSLLTANELNCTSIAFPAISIGIFACDVHTCAELALQAIADTAPTTQLQNIYLLISTKKSDQVAQAYKKALLDKLEERYEKI